MTEQVSIDSLRPDAGSGLGDDAIAAHYSFGARSPWLRANFVSSVDGAATHDGLSEGLGGPADRRVFDILRRLCDVVLVGAGTVRAERYGPMRVAPDAVAWREANGLAPQPTLAIVSGRLDLDPSSPVFTEAPVRPIVVTTGASPAGQRAVLERVSDVLVAGEDLLDPVAMIEALSGRGLGRILCEGGPSLFGTLLAADVVDELCLTVSPRLEAGDAGRIAHKDLPSVRTMSLGGVLASGDTLLLRYLRLR